MDTELQLCPWEHQFPKDGHKLCCVREAGHEERHYPFSAWNGGFTIYEFNRPTGELSVVMQAETRGKLTREEIAAVYAYMVAVQEARSG